MTTESITLVVAYDQTFSQNNLDEGDSDIEKANDVSDRLNVIDGIRFGPVGSTTVGVENGFVIMSLILVRGVTRKDDRDITAVLQGVKGYLTHGYATGEVDSPTQLTRRIIEQEGLL